MDLVTKLQLRPGQGLRIVDAPEAFALEVEASGDVVPDGLLVFARTAADLATRSVEILAAARSDRLTWVAYPKAGQLGTDLNRDRLAAALHAGGATPVRQVALDETWSALRFRPA
ncbi:MAG: hypothetical protein ACXWOT_09305 [Candidatus Limnocylindrales bacterium]